MSSNNSSIKWTNGPCSSCELHAIFNLVNGPFRLLMQELTWQVLIPFQHKRIVPLASSRDGVCILLRACGRTKSRAYTSKPYHIISKLTRGLNFVSTTLAAGKKRVLQKKIAAQKRGGRSNFEGTQYIELLLCNLCYANHQLPTLQGCQRMWP